MELMATLSYAKTVTVESTYVDSTGVGRIYYNVVKYDSDGDSITYQGTLALETEGSIFDLDQIKVTTAGAKAYFNGTLKINQSSSATLNDGGDIGATKTLGTFKVTVAKAHTEKTVTYKLVADTLTVYGKAGSSSKTVTNSCGTKSESFTIAAKTHYTVSYNANGGSGAPGSQTKWYNETLTLSTTKPTRTGYTFAGWYTAASGGSKYGATYTANSGATLYAHWTANTYTLYYNANGGSVSPTSASRTYGSQYGTLPTPTRTGYSFNGWWTAASGGSQVSSSTKMGTSNITIYAHWVEQTYQLTYSVGHDIDPINVTMSYAKQTVAIEAPFVDGWTFQYWRDMRTGAHLQPGDVIKAANTITYELTMLSAQWIPNVCEVTLDNEGTEVKIYAKYNDGYYSDEECTISLTQIDIPTKQHYTFDGYYLNMTKYINADGTFVGTPTFTDNVTFTINWIPEVYTITLDNNGATTVGTAVYYEKYEVGSYEDIACTTSMTTIVKPQKVGYTFNGYYSGQTQYIDNNGEIIQFDIGADSIILAAWTINKYNLIFNPMGGIINGTTDSLSVLLEYGETYTNFPNPTRAGYTFEGWYTTTDGSGDEITEYTMGNQNYTLYAYWSPLSIIDDSYTYTTIDTGKVSVKANNNSLYGLIPYSITSSAGDKLIITSLEECFKGTDVEGYVYMNCSAVENVNGIFDGVSNDVCIVFGSDFKEFSEVWDTINNTYENVTYLGADDTDYFYTVNENKNLNIRVKDKTKEMYGLPLLEIENGDYIWTPTTMNKCYQGCRQLQGVLPVHNNPSSAVDIFEDIGEDATIYLLCLEPNALTTWQNIADNWQ